MVPALEAAIILGRYRFQVRFPPALSAIPATQLKKTDMPPFTIVLGWGACFRESPRKRNLTHLVHGRNTSRVPCSGLFQSAAISLSGAVLVLNWNGSVAATLKNTLIAARI